jgi:hypothetical protein
MGDVRWALRGDAVRVARRDSVLVLSPAAAPGTLEAALVVRRASRAFALTGADAEGAMRTIPDSLLGQWERAPSPSQAGAADGRSHGRWFWAAVLLLLVVEQVVRGRTRVPAAPPESHA